MQVYTLGQSKKYTACMFTEEETRMAYDRRNPILQAIGEVRTAFRWQWGVAHYLPHRLCHSRSKSSACGTTAMLHMIAPSFTTLGLLLKLLRRGIWVESGDTIHLPLIVELIYLHHPM
jgi:hypothetical protein